MAIGLMVKPQTNRTWGPQRHNAHRRGSRLSPRQEGSVVYCPVHLLVWSWSYNFWPARRGVPWSGEGYLRISLYFVSGMFSTPRSFGAIFSTNSGVLARKLRLQETPSGQLEGMNTSFSPSIEQLRSQFFYMRTNPQRRSGQQSNWSNWFTRTGVFLFLKQFNDFTTKSLNTLTISPQNR